MFNLFSNSSFDDFYKSFNLKFSNSSHNTNYNWEDLKTKGTVEETSEETNGIRTVTRIFTSADGETKITSVTSEPIANIQKQQLIEIEKQLKLAVAREDYEEASRLQKEKKNLLTPTKSNK